MTESTEHCACKVLWAFLSNGEIEKVLPDGKRPDVVTPSSIGEVKCVPRRKDGKKPCLVNVEDRASKELSYVIECNDLTMRTLTNILVSDDPCGELHKLNNLYLEYCSNKADA